jgi:hypothetical protein
MIPKVVVVSNREILRIFGVRHDFMFTERDSDDQAQYTEEKDIENIQYITFLLMARAGVRALEFYDPKSHKHLQAHMQARRVLNLGAVKPH